MLRAAHRLYGLFIKDGEGPLCTRFFADLEEAKLQAQTLAEIEGRDYFIFDLSHLVEVARIVPPNTSKSTKE